MTSPPFDASNADMNLRTPGVLPGLSSLHVNSLWIHDTVMAEFNYFTVDKSVGTGKSCLRIWICHQPMP